MDAVEMQNDKFNIRFLENSISFQRRWKDNQKMSLFLRHV